MDRSVQSYVVRVYRREPGTGEPAAGLVVSVATGARKRFTNADDLWQALIRLPAEEAERDRAEPDGNG